MIEKSNSAQPLRKLPPAPSRKTVESAEPRESFAPSTEGPGEPAWGQSLTGDIRYHQVKSKILGNSRGVWVYLPPNYHANPDKHFPVLYMNDGQNAFERGTAFGGREWEADEAAQAMILGGKMRDTIIVAVSNSGRGRMDEYTQVADANSSPDPEHPGGKADLYGKFLIDELKPMIDSRYRTEKEATNTGILGSSLGGLVATHLAFTRPDVFGVLIPMSPSIWWANRDILKELSSIPEGQGPNRIWLDMGTHESQTDANHNGVPDVLDDARALKALLEKRGYQEGKNLTYWEVPGGTHSEQSWSERIADVFVGMYPRQDYTIAGASPDSGQR